MINMRSNSIFLLLILSLTVAFVACSSSLTKGGDVIKAAESNKGTSLVFEYEPGTMGKPDDDRMTFSFICKSWRDDQAIKDFFFRNVDIKSDAAARVDQAAGYLTKEGFVISFSIKGIRECLRIEPRFEFELRVRGHVGAIVSYAVNCCVARPDKLSPWEKCNGQNPSCLRLNSNKP